MPSRWVGACWGWLLWGKGMEHGGGGTGAYGDNAWARKGVGQSGEGQGAAAGAAEQVQRCTWQPSRWAGLKPAWRTLPPQQHAQLALAVSGPLGRQGKAPLSDPTFLQPGR